MHGQWNTVRNGRLTFVRIDRTERKVLSGHAGFSENVEEGRFSEGREREQHDTKCQWPRARRKTHPAFGRPTIPIFRFVPTRPINGFGFVSSFFFGGIVSSVGSDLEYPSSEHSRTVHDNNDENEIDRTLFQQQYVDDNREEDRRLSFSFDRFSRNYWTEYSNEKPRPSLRTLATLNGNTRGQRLTDTYESCGMPHCPRQIVSMMVCALCLSLLRRTVRNRWPT